MKATPTKPIREKERQETVRAQGLRLQRLVQTLSSSGCAVEFRLLFREGRGRVIISAADHTSREAVEQRLMSAVRAHLPEYGPMPCDLPRSTGTGMSIPIAGVPEAMENPLEPLSRYFLENDFDGEYIFAFENRRVNPLRRLASRAEQRKVAKRAGGQTTKQATVAGEQHATTVRDHAEEMRLEDWMKVVERHHSPLALRCWVWVTGYSGSAAGAETIARGASSVVVGSLSGHKPGSALRVGPPRGPPESPEDIGRPTIMLPSEAVPFAWIPQHALGTAVVPSSEFELPPELKGEVSLGQVVLQSGPTKHEVRLPLDMLKRHMFVTGITGGGKSTTCFSVLLQLYELGIPWLVLEPVKSEYRSLLMKVDPMQVFTLGDETTAPFRLNIFEPPPGVHVQTHLENLSAAWESSFVMYSPLPLVAKRVFVETYRACGWNLLHDRRGRAISLDDLLAQTERLVPDMGYEEKVKMDIEAAMKLRISSLKLGGKGPMLDCLASTPLEGVMGKPTVVELRAVPNPQEKSFVASLLLMNVAEYVEARGHSGQLRHLTLIEEAHRLLPNVSTQKGDPEGADPRKGMVEHFGNMLAEVRAYGEGLVVVEQIPTKIIPDAIKNTATKVAHRVPAEDDRRLLGGAMNLTEEQEAAFAGLEPGGAIVSVERHPFPIRVQVPDVVRRLGLAVGEVGDETVRKHMVEYYLRNPLPRAPERSEEMEKLVGARWFGAKFKEAYGAWLDKGDTGPLGSLVMGAAGKFSEERDGKLDAASKMLSLAVGLYLPFDEEDRAKFPKVVMREIERSTRDVQP